ncbi:MAG: hypothetical protein PUC50_02475 [Bacteroidales bacterium]|nr:hypothetical protein [Bacteroidales bacterium]
MSSIISDLLGKAIGTLGELFSKGTKDKNGVIQAELDPVYITLVAPRGAGKTSLLATVVTYIKNHINVADGFSVRPCTDLDSTRIAKFNSDLSIKLQAGSFKFDSGFLRGDNELSKFDFELNFNIENENTVLKQRFVVMDIPGGWISDNIPFPNEFTEHFHKSRILWIPVEAPALMEVNEKSESDKKHAASVLCVDRVFSFIKEWADVRKKKKEPCSANFVITKCETYHSQDETGDKTRWTECRRRFNLKYDEIINKIHEIDGNIKLSYVPVETIGFVKIYKSEWDTVDGRSVLKAEYKFTKTGVNPDIKGVDSLMSTVLDYCYTNLDNRIKKDIEKLDEAIKKGGLWEKLFGNKEKTKEALEKFHKKIEPLKQKMLELKVPSEFSRKYSTPV